MIDTLRQIERDKGVPMDALVDAMQQALVSAYKKKYGASGSVRVALDFDRAEFQVFAQKTVVERANNPYTEVSWREAQKARPAINLGETIEVEVTPEDFGRIAAQTAKQVILQRIREAERESIYDEFSGREGELVTGEVQRKERRNVFISLGRVEALLPPGEQVPNESYRFGERLKVYVLEVRKAARSPQIVVSRTHPNLVKKLFELEVPEIRDGILTLKSVAREPGARTKIAVHSSEANVDPVGACVGQRGQRVQAVVDELSGEKIDIIHWNEDPTEFIKQSLSPAKVSNVILNTEDRSAIVIVAEDQQSLAIGRLGQNVRLAARLTSWRIDIRTQDKYEKELREKESGPVILASNEALSADALSVEDEAPAQDEVTQAEGTEAIESSLDPVGTAAVSVNGSMEEDDDAVEQTPQQEAVLVEQVSTAEEVKGASPDAGYQSEAAEDPLRETDPSADR